MKKFELFMMSSQNDTSFQKYGPDVTNNDVINSKTVFLKAIGE